jgi:hypothetical protein
MNAMNYFKDLFAPNWDFDLPAPTLKGPFPLDCNIKPFQLENGNLKYDFPNSYDFEFANQYKMSKI